MWRADSCGVAREAGKISIDIQLKLGFRGGVKPARPQSVHDVLNMSAMSPK